MKSTADRQKNGPEDKVDIIKLTPVIDIEPSTKARNWKVVIVW